MIAVHHASQEILQQSLELSRRLLTLMKEGAWEEAEALEAERFRLIRKGLAAAPDQALPEKIAILREIDALNGEMASLAGQGKSKLSGQLRHLQQGRKAGRAYRQSRKA